MIEYNIYSGRRGRIDYQETGNFESLLEAELYAQEISEWMPRNMVIQLRSVNGWL